MRYWIVGAGPAGCTLARALAEKTDARIVILERLIRHIREHPGVWFATHEQVARYVKEEMARTSN